MTIINRCSSNPTCLALLNWCAKVWSKFREAFEAASPCRLSLLISCAVPLIFWKIEQAAEVLRCLAEGQEQGSFWNCVQVVLFFFALLFLCLHGWYFSRVLLYFHFSDSPKLTPTVRFTVLHLPRIIGVIPAVGMGLALWAASLHYLTDGSQAKLTLRVYAGISWFIVILLSGFFMARQRRRLKSKEGEKALTPELESSKDLADTTKRVIGTMACLSAALFFVLFLAPVKASQVIGSGAILLFAAASWICYGSALIYFSHRWRLPLVGVTICLAVLFSLWNDNHGVRTLIPASSVAPPTLEECYTNWEARIQKRFPNETNHPVIIVATEGGGIRAAFWTATVLGTLQDANPHFASHVFAISGVSGGSLGAVVFDALLADGVTSNITQTAQNILSHDFLSPALGYMLYPEVVQRLLPFPIPLCDRARALELAWEDGWRSERKNNLFNTALDDLWRKEPSLPNLFLNGTSVESGKRIITSNVLIDDIFVDSVDARTVLDGGLRLSTAAHMSSRFTYVSPAGRFTNGQHVVDGGYFENSAAATADDIFWKVHDLASSNVSLVVIFIKNNPTAMRIMRPGQKQDAPPPRDLLSELSTPILTMLHTRSARGSYSETMLANEDDDQRNFLFSLHSGAMPLPLGWQLSRGAVDEMRQQMVEPDEWMYVTNIVALLPNPNLSIK
jgi:predicted acylesterase/phospholipase RssA